MPRASSLLAAAALCHEGSLVGAIRAANVNKHVDSKSAFGLTEPLAGFSSNGDCSTRSDGSQWTETSPAFTIKVFPSTTTVEFDKSSNMGRKLFGMLGKAADDFVGDKGGHSTVDFKQMLCTDDVSKVFPNACDFFKSKNLATTCAPLAAAIKALKVGGQAAGVAREAGHQAGELAREAGHQAGEFYDRRTVAFEPSGKLSDVMTASSWSCGKTTWKQTIESTESAPIMKIEVGASISTVTVESASSDIPKDFAGEFKTTDFKEKVCSEDLKDIFPHACDFLTTGGLAIACPHVSASIYALEAKEVASDAAGRVKAWYKAAPLFFMPAGGLASLGIVTKDSGSCGVKHWSQTLLSKGEQAMKIRVGPSQSSVEIEGEYAGDINNVLPGFEGEHKTSEFKEKVCTKEVMEVFPYACDFLQVSNGLALSCPTIFTAIKAVEGKNKLMNMFGK